MGRRAKGFGAYVAQQAVGESLPLGVSASRLKVAHAKQQAPLPYRELHHKAQLVATLYVVYHLHRGQKRLRQGVKDERTAVLHYREPLPIGTLIGRKTRSEEHTSELQ